MKMILPLMMLLLAACKGGGSDGYVFEDDAKRIEPQQTIVVNLYHNTGLVTDRYKQANGIKRDLVSEDVFGFTSYNGRTCNIHIVDPAVSYKPEKIGHELTHCLYGNFHKTQDK